jgi:Dolichyl-phosphate-mannose-protein mannosyltransferase
VSDDRPVVLAPETDLLAHDRSGLAEPVAPSAEAAREPWYQHVRRVLAPRRSVLAVAAVAAVAVAAGVVSLAVSRLVFPHFSTNNDEPVYVFQARLLLDHRLTLPITPDARFFRPWMSGDVGSRLTMVFPPVLPALLALGQAVLGSMRAVLALLAVAAVVLVAAVARLVTNDRRAAAIAALLLASCPLFIVQSGLFLSYVLALDLELGAALLLLVGTRTRRLRWFAAGGAVLGVLFFSRPFDAVLVGVPLLAAGLFVGSAGAAEIRRRAMFLVVGAAPIMFASFAYNAGVTGSPFRLPLAAIGGNNDAGFGVRRLTTGTPAVPYTWHRALWATQRNLGALPGWVSGGLILLALAAFGLYRFRRSAWAWAWAAVVVTIPLGYLFYWGNLLVASGRRSIGPHYYLALLVPLAVLGSVPLAAFSRRQRAGGAVIVAAVLVGTCLSILPKVQLDRRSVALHNRERRLVDGAHLHNAIVFLPSEPPDGAWLMHPRPSFMNDPELRQPVLFALDHKADNFALVDDHPGRAFYRELSRIPARDAAHRYAPVLWRLSPTSARTFSVRTHIVNRDGQTVVTAYLADGTRRYRYCLDQHSTAGRAYDVVWTITPDGVQFVAVGQAPGSTAVLLPDDATALTDPPAAASRAASPVSAVVAGELTVGAELGADTDRGAAALTEERFWFRRRPDGADLMLPGEQWHHDVRPRRLWTAQDDPDRLAVDVRSS